MKKIERLKPFDCHHTQGLLDDFISDELSIETNQAILTHLEQCQACQALQQARLEERAKLAQAWQAQEIPDQLEKKIRDGLASPTISRFVYLKVAAALILILGGGYLLFSLPWAVAPGDSIAAQLQQVDHFQEVIEDHLHCIGRDPEPNEVLPIQDLAQLRQIPELSRHYQLASVHFCSFGDVDFIHYQFNGPAQKLSLILEKRLASQSLKRSASDLWTQVAEEDVYLVLGRDPIRVVSLEAGDFFVYVVSEEPSLEKTFQLAESLIRVVRSSLDLIDPASLQS